MPRDPDDTVLIHPTAPRRRGWPLIAGAVGLIVALAAGGVLFLQGGVSGMPAAAPAAPASPARSIVLAPPRPVIASASEAELQTEVPAALTMLRFAANPRILVIDFPTLAEQGRMLNRLAAFVEKAGSPHDRLLDDGELFAAITSSGASPDTYYYGHDYRAADVNRFFEIADRDHRRLDPEEQQLRALVRQASEEPPGFGALITLTKVDPEAHVDQAARTTILHHELSHGEYFTNPLYAHAVEHFWRFDLTAAERAAFRAYLAAEGYDPALEDVMMNETQAYLMHTPDPRFFDVGRLGISAPRLAELRQIFTEGMPAGWLKDETPYRN